MKTYSVKPKDISRSWYVLDASELPLGRLSTEAAKLLTGKHKPIFSHHIDTGDYVIIINADNLVVTGDKADKKLYHRHSSYPGGLKTQKLRQVIESDSTKVIYQSVRGMLPVNKLRALRLNRLKIYNDLEHGHQAQKPITFKVGK